MKTTRYLPRLAVLALALPHLPAVHAQTLDFGSCVRIEDLSARLACYDRAAGRTPGNAASPAAPVTPAPSAAPPAPAARTPQTTATVPAPSTAPAVQAAPPGAPAATANPEASFGRASLPAAKQEATEPEKLEARVTAVRKLARGEQVLTLENGQVWQQTEVRSEPQYREGDVVVIRKGMFGSYLLTRASGSPTTRVKRIS